MTSLFGILLKLISHRSKYVSKTEKNYHILSLYVHVMKEKGLIKDRSQILLTPLGKYCVWGQGFKEKLN